MRYFLIRTRHKIESYFFFRILFLAEINCPGDYECASSITTDADLVNFQCITMDLVCNGRTDCPKEDDEIQCGKCLVNQSLISQSINRLRVMLTW